ncbi:MAG: 30S ribosomal protein S20 [Chloroflexota bacterium]|nr:30S ribosomal protein S20 [Chloroflexota bacterium]
MANSKSAKKRIRVSERQRLRNKPHRTEARSSVRRAEQVMTEGSTPEAIAAVKHAISTLDRVASKGVIHKNNAARRKSRLMAKLNKFQAEQAAA